MQIIKATTEHDKELHRIHTAAVHASCKSFYTEGQLKGWLTGRSPEGYHSGIKNDEMYIAVDKGEIVGFGHAIPGEVVAIFVDPTSHGKGVGRRLLEHGLKIASKNHAKIKVDATLNAEGFYKKHGFVKVGDGAHTRNGVEIPVVVMEYLNTPANSSL